MQDRVVVTGGAGYIGSHLCKALAHGGYQPVTFDNLSRGHAHLVRYGTLEQVDILDTEAITRLLSHYQPVAVVHCAGFIAVGESMTDPGLYYQQNVMGTLSLLNAMRQTGTTRLIFSSSCAVHGTPEAQPITEDMPYAPHSPYGQTKMMAEQMIRDYGYAYGLRYVLFRYFNACGADPEGELGECHEPETHLIPRALQAVITGTPLALFGNDYPTPDGTPIRDYVHVTDIADAHLLGLRYLLEGRASDIFNIGQGRGYSVSEILLAIQGILGKQVPFEWHARRAGDVPMLLAQTQKIRDALGFVPRHSSLEEILTSAYQWELQRRSILCR